MKSVLITGANKGIGRETARQLSKQGFFVYVGARDLESGNAAVRKFNDDGLVNVKAVLLNVTKPETIAAAKSVIEQEQRKLDVLINNAGISGVVPQNARESSPEYYHDVFAVNLHGVIRVTQTFLPLLGKSSAPRIVNVSTSVGSLTLQSSPAWPAYHYGKYAIYAASKAAMNMYTVHLAYELRDTPFKINAVCPGYTKTDFTNHQGGEVDAAAQRVVKYALLGNDGPTGKFFSEESNPETGEIPW